MATANKKKKPRNIGGPFLASALVCESFLEDQSGKISAIGISDGCIGYITKEAPLDFPSKDHPAMMQITVLIIFRSGDSPGKHRLKLVMQQPDGKRSRVFEKDIELTTPLYGGCNIRTNAQLVIHSTGVFWIDVILNQKRVTRIPYNVAFQRLPEPETTLIKK